MSEEKFLGRDDLFLLMKSYENNVAINTTLLEQLKHVVEKQNDLLDKHADINILMNQLIKDISVQSEGDRNHTKFISEVIEKNMQTTKSFEDKNSAEHKEISEKTTNIKWHIKYIYSGLVSIIISLLTVIYLIVDKLDLIDKIAKFFGVQ